MTWSLRLTALYCMSLSALNLFSVVRSHFIVTGRKSSTTCLLLRTRSSPRLLHPAVHRCGEGCCFGRDVVHSITYSGPHWSQDWSSVRAGAGSTTKTPPTGPSGFSSRSRWSLADSGMSAPRFWPSRVTNNSPPRCRLRFRQASRPGTRSSPLIRSSPCRHWTSPNCQHQDTGLIYSNGSHETSGALPLLKQGIRQQMLHPSLNTVKARTMKPENEKEARPKSGEKS